MKPYYAIKALYTPTIVEVSSGRYAVSGSKWIEVGPEVTQEMVESTWEPLYPRDETEYAERKFLITSSRSEEKHTVTEKGGVWKCSCPGFEYHKKCRHIEQAKTNLRDTLLDRKGVKKI